ncbi:MAG TPA: hypothetical protein VGH89_32545 [Pseudonocardia sp.]
MCQLFAQAIELVHPLLGGGNHRSRVLGRFGRDRARPPGSLTDQPVRFGVCRRQQPVRLRVRPADQPVRFVTRVGEHSVRLSPAARLGVVDFGHCLGATSRHGNVEVVLHLLALGRTF